MLTRRRTGALLLSIAASACLAGGQAAQAQQSAVRVAAASDLRFALDELIEAFHGDTGIDVRPAYGSSGNLARQIEQGAPFELFMSADETFVMRLSRKGLTLDDGALYAVGRIVLFAPTGSELVPDIELRDFRTRLANGTLRRFAIANPEHAPYGRAAEQALRSLGSWESVQPTLVLGENIAQAAQFAASGNTDGGIIAYSLVLASQFRERGRFALIPDTLHEPLRQRMALTRRATPAAAAFYAYLCSAPSRVVLERYGFTLPSE